MHLGHRSDQFEDSLFMKFVCFVFFYSFYFLSSPSNDFLFLFFDMHFKNTIFPLQVIYTLSFYKCLRTTHYDANPPYILDAGNVNVGWSQSVGKCNSSCDILVQSGLIVLNWLCRGRSF